MDSEDLTACNEASVVSPFPQPQPRHHFLVRKKTLEIPQSSPLALDLPAPYTSPALAPHCAIPLTTPSNEPHFTISFSLLFHLVVVIQPLYPFFV